MESVNTNLIEASQWDAQWAISNAPRRLRSWRSYVSWRFATLFRQYIKPGDRVLEVGCGGSRFLPYFAKELQAEVWGLDFAPAGVQTAKAALLRAGTSGTIVEGDLFTTQDIPRNYFDVVFSAGFIEHFVDTANVVQHISRFAKAEGGVVITEVPNLSGWIGKARETLDPANYHQHVHITPASMDGAHREAGTEPIQKAHYFGTFQPGVLSYRRLLERLPSPVGRLMMRGLEVPEFLITAPLWAFRLNIESANISPYVVGVYHRIR